MVYLYIKGCFNIYSNFSSVMALWKDVETNAYYISRDFPEIVKPTIDNSYLLMYEPKEPKTSPYKDFLTDYKQVSNLDFILGFIEYEGSRWILN